MKNSFLSLELDFSDPINYDEELEKFKQNGEEMKKFPKSREDIMKYLKAKLC